MEKLRRPLSWFLARFRNRNDKEFETLRLSVSGGQARREPPPLLEKTEDLLWTCR